MIASTLVTLALSLTLGQHQPAAHGEAADPHAPAAAVEQGGHGGGHDESLGAVMMHHVVDGDVIEYPGVCEKDGAHGFHWN